MECRDEKHYPVQYETGDIVFTCIGAALFGQISTASQCWSNHVGIIIGHNGDDYLVAESRVPSQPSPRCHCLYNVQPDNVTRFVACAAA